MVGQGCMRKMRGRKRRDRIGRKECQRGGERGNVVVNG